MDKATRVFLASTLMSTLCVLAVFLVMKAFASVIPSQTHLAAFLVSAAAVYMAGAAAVMRRLEGAFTPTAVAGFLPATTAIMGVCFAANSFAREPAFLFGGFLFGVVVGVYALMKNVDEAVSAKVLMAGMLVQIMVLHWTLG